MKRIRAVVTLLLVCFLFAEALVMPARATTTTTTQDGLEVTVEMDKEMYAPGEPITATITLKTERTDLKVWGVNPEGFYTSFLPATYEDGVFKFTIGKEFESMYYLVQEQ